MDEEQVEDPQSYDDGERDDDEQEEPLGWEGHVVDPIGHGPLQGIQSTGEEPLPASTLMADLVADARRRLAGTLNARRPMSRMDKPEQYGNEDDDRDLYDDCDCPEDEECSCDEDVVENWYANALRDTDAPLARLSSFDLIANQRQRRHQQGKKPSRRPLSERVANKLMRRIESKVDGVIEEWRQQQ